MALGIVALLTNALTWAAAITSVAQPSRLVVDCHGGFRDQGLSTREHAAYRIGNDGVQVWDGAASQWIYYSCLGRCWTSNHHVYITDGYTTARRGYVYHLFDLDLRTSRLDEEWMVGDDLLQFTGTCAPAVDPTPTLAGVEASTRRGDLSIYALAYGLPLPIPRRDYEPRRARSGSALAQTNDSALQAR